MGFVNVERDLDVIPEINAQILDYVAHKFFEDVDIGYIDNHQKAVLETNTRHIMKSLCFVQRHWKVLLRQEFPIIPNNADESASYSKLLKEVAKAVRTKKNE